MNWLSDFLSSPNLNGSTAPNSSAIPLSTPVNTSGGNTNTSGWTLGGVLSTLSGLGTNAANAYALINGTGSAHATTATAGGSAAAPAKTSYLPWIIGGAVVVGLIALLARRK